MKASLSLVVVVGLVTGCSNSNNNSNSSPTGLASGTQLSTLTASQQATMCTSVASYTASHTTVSSQQAIDAICMITAYGAGGNAATCHAAYDACLVTMADAGTTTDAGVTTDAGTNTCSSQSLTTCTITSDQLDKCIEDTIAAENAALNSLSTAAFCDAIGTDASTTTTTAPASCTVVTNNCPQMVPSTATN